MYNRNDANSAKKRVSCIINQLGRVYVSITGH